MTWNVCEYISSRLSSQFGYEEVGHPSVLQRRIDNQHLVQASIRPFNRGAAGTRAGVEFALGRRDINELMIDVFSSPLGSWTASVLELRGDHRFLGRPDGHWIVGEATEADVDAFLERWVPPLDGIANLAFIEEYIATNDPEWDDENRDRVKQMFWSTAVANRMLSGWSPERDEHFLQYRIDSVAHFEPDSRMRVLTEGQVVTIREWIAENPNGVERELTG